MNRVGLDRPSRSLKSKAVRGTAVNAAFLLAVDAVALIQGVVVSGLIGPSEIGLYGVASATVVSLIALKRAGIDEQFVRLAEEGEEQEFRRAFGADLLLSAALVLLIAVLAGPLSLLYGDSRLLPVLLAVAYLPLVLAFQAPAWVFFRRMDFVKQRSLQVSGTLVTALVAVTLAYLGLGAWSLVIAVGAGSTVSALLAIRLSPYRLRLELEWGALSRYTNFSLPLVVAAVASLFVIQGQLLAFDFERGIVGAGFIALAVTLTRYADRADQIVAPSIYPAICALKDRTDELERIFVRISKGALLWTLPFCAGVLLFAPDLFDLFLGSRWRPALPLAQGLAATAAISQICFCWFLFYHARGITRPSGVEALVGAGGFAALAVPGLFLFGSAGFIVGRVVAAVAVLAVRLKYVRAIFPAVSILRLTAAAARPVLIAVAAVVLVRLGLWGGDRSLLQLAGELALFLTVYGWVALKFERDLIATVVRLWRIDPLATTDQ